MNIDKMIFLETEIDFKTKIPVRLFVRDYHSPQFDFNVFGSVIKMGRRDHQAIFRFRFPSGRKTIVKSGIRTSVDAIMVEINAHLAIITEKFDSDKNVHLELVHQFDVDVPKNCQNMDGFMALLTASDKFDIYKGKDADEALKKMKGI